VFLIILFFVTRYILRMIQAFFRSIDGGAIRLVPKDQWHAPPASPPSTPGSG